MADCSLKSLRQAQADEFVALMRRALAGGERCTIREELGVVDEESAAKLARVGITSKRRLVEEAGRPQPRKELATELGMDAATLKRWAHLAEMLERIESQAKREIVPRGFATLLQQSGAASIEEFTKAYSDSGEDLAERLAALNRRCAAVAWEPPGVTLQLWFEKLKEAPSRVS